MASRKRSKYNLLKGFTRSLPPSATQSFQEDFNSTLSSITAAVLMFLSLKQDRIRAAFKDRNRLHSQLSRTLRRRAEGEAGVDNSSECTTCSNGAKYTLYICLYFTGTCPKRRYFKVQDILLFVVPWASVAVNHVKYNNLCYLSIFENVSYKLIFLQIQKKNHVDTIYFRALLRYTILNPPLNIFVLVCYVLNWHSV